MQELLEVMRRLRAPDGCPWDREQTHRSLRPYLLEEAAEAVDAISAGDGEGGLAELPGELGDVLLQVAFHSVIAEEAGTFTYGDVERHIVQKLIRRHPHVFGEVSVSGSAEVVSNWQAIKAAERGGRPRPAAGRVPTALGALAREAQAQKLQDGHGEARYGEAGYGAARHAGTRADIAAALAGAAGTPEGVADVLAAVVAWARTQGVDAELALRERTGATLARLPDEAGA